MFCTRKSLYGIPRQHADRSCTRCAPELPPTSLFGGEEDAQQFVARTTTPASRERVAPALETKLAWAAG
jgi:hypothetical protein